MNFYVYQLKQKLMCISETALMFKILLNIFYLCYAPNVNEGHKSVRFMIDVIGFSDIKRPLIFSVIVTLLEKEGTLKNKR